MKSIVRVYCVCFVLIITNSGIIAQTKKPWPAGIPSSFREQLVQKLKQYIEFEQGQEFGSQYDLFDKATMVRTKVEYVEARRKSERLVKFEPRSITCSKVPTTCRIEGRADLQWADAIPLRCEVSLNAKLQNNEWSLSEWSGADDCFPGMEKLTTTSPEITDEPVPKKKQKP